MKNYVILADATPEAAATSSAGSTMQPAPAKEVPAERMDESGATMSTTQTPGTPPAKQVDEKGQQATPNPWWNIMFIVVIFVVMYFMFIRGPKKQQQQQKEMISSLQKNDRVRTVGGIIGTVVDVKDEYVTLKIDEATNTKIRVVPQAISKNLAPETKD